MPKPKSSRKPALDSNDFKENLRCLLEHSTLAVRKQLLTILETLANAFRQALVTNDFRAAVVAARRAAEEVEALPE